MDYNDADMFILISFSLGATNGTYATGGGKTASKKEPHSRNGKYVMLVTEGFM